MLGPQGLREDQREEDHPAEREAPGCRRWGLAEQKAFGRSRDLGEIWGAENRAAREPPVAVEGQV